MLSPTQCRATFLTPGCRGSRSPHNLNVKSNSQETQIFQWFIKVLQQCVRGSQHMSYISTFSSRVNSAQQSSVEAKTGRRTPGSESLSFQQKKQRIIPKEPTDVHIFVTKLRKTRWNQCISCKKEWHFLHKLSHKSNTSKEVLKSQYKLRNLTGFFDNLFCDVAAKMVPTVPSAQL